VTILTTVLTGLLWLTCLLIIVLVLLQTGKGGSLAGVFGGGGGADSLLGTRATSFLVKATVVLCVVFLVLCLTLNRLRVPDRSRYATPPASSPEDKPPEEPDGVTEQVDIPAEGQGGTDRGEAEEAGDAAGTEGKAERGDDEAAGREEGSDDEAGAGPGE
jgi:preprotein translocase subunit SecG